MKRGKILTALAKAGREACEQNDLLDAANDALLAAKGETFRLKDELAAAIAANGRLSAERGRLSKFACIIGDLDRCRHGRHQADGCYECPGSVSSGNPYLPAGQIIGYDISGRPIVVPRREVRNDPDAWGSRR